MQFVFDFTRLSAGDIQLVTVITNAACIRYQLMGGWPSFERRCHLAWTHVLLCQDYGTLLLQLCALSQCH